MEIKRVALIGAGAVGAYFIYGFCDLEGLDFCVVAEGKRAERLKNDGININDKVYFPTVKSPDEANGVDVLLVCTKYDGLHSALDMIEKVVGENTNVISLLNGIDSEEIIGERIGMEHMMYSVMRISSERRDGKITFPVEKTFGVTIGEKSAPSNSDRVVSFTALMEKAGLRCKILEDIVGDMWAKYSMNMIYNIPQAILNVGFGAYFESEYVGKIRDKMFEEVSLIAKEEGVELGEQGDWRALCMPNARFSTLQDIDAHRHTEIEMLAGVLIKLAKKHGKEVPFAEFAYLAIKSLEEKNDGRFDAFELKK